MTKKVAAMGPDISTFNGKVDFDKLKDQVDFVIIRCGYGSNYEYQDDDRFKRNADECERVGIPYGVYLYSYATDLAAVESEVRHVKRLIKGRKISRGIWYDLEDKVLPKDKKTLTDICLKFIRLMEKEGHIAGFYTSLNWMNTRFDDDRLEGKRLWLAQWNETMDYEGKCDVVMWQHTSEGKISGQKGNFDLNWYFEETEEEIKEKEEDLRTTIYRVRVTPNIGLNVRQSPNTESKIIRAVPKGTVLDIVVEYENWGELAGGGWVCLDYTKKIMNYAEFEVKPDVGLNVRTGPGTKFDIIEALPKGTKVKITQIRDGWGARLGGGYLKMEYLKLV